MIMTGRKLESPVRLQTTRDFSIIAVNQRITLSIGINSRFVHLLCLFQAEVLHSFHHYLYAFMRQGVVQ